MSKYHARPLPPKCNQALDRAAMQQILAAKTLAMALKADLPEAQAWKLVGVAVSHLLEAQQAINEIRTIQQQDRES